MWKKKKETPPKHDWEDRLFPIQPSPIDSRDYIYSAQNHILLPDQVDLRPALSKPRDSGSRRSNLAFATASIKEYHERINLDFDGCMSPESILFYVKNKKSQNCREMMKILQKRGISPEKFFPFQYQSEPTEIPESAKIIMSNFRIRQYAQVETIQAAKEAIFKYGPLLMSFPIHKNSPILWKPSNKNKNVIGGHAVAIVGYNQEGFIIRNSWSASWNGDGHVIYPYSDWKSHWEIWTCIDDISDLTQMTQALAKPSNLLQKIKETFSRLF